MKRIKLPLIVLAMVVLTMVIVQSCNLGGSVDQPNQPELSNRQKKRAMLKKDNQRISKQYQIKKMIPLTDAQILHHMKSIYNGGGGTYKKLHVQSQSSTAGRYHGTPFTKGLLGKLNYKDAKIIALKNGDTFVRVPAIKGNKFRNHKYIRIAHLMFKKSNPSDGTLIVKQISREFLKIAKVQGYSLLEREIHFTGIVKAYKLHGKHVISLKGLVFNNGLVTKTITLAAHKEKNKYVKGAKFIAGAKTTSCCWDFSNMLAEAYHTTTSFFSDCGYLIGDALEAAGATAGCGASIAGEIPTGGWDTAVSITACSATVYFDVKFVYQVSHPHAGCAQHF